MYPGSKPRGRKKTFPGPWITLVHLQTTRLDMTLDCFVKPNTLVKPSHAQQRHDVNFHLGLVPSGLKSPVGLVAVFPPFGFGESN